MKLLKTMACLAFVVAAHLTPAAAASVWKIVPDKSSLMFTATQNGAPVKGDFKKFSGEINFDLDQLKDSKVKIIVDMGSLSTSYNDLTMTLKTPDWFDMKLFPEAIFEASEFTKTGDNEYQAKGTLTLRDKSQPVVLNFTASQTGNNAMVKGSTTIKRTAFGVGRGEWSSLNEIKDDVKVDFLINATK